MQQTKKFKMADAISPYLAVSCGLMEVLDVSYHKSAVENIGYTVTN